MKVSAFLLFFGQQISSHSAFSKTGIMLLKGFFLLSVCFFTSNCFSQTVVNTSGKTIGDNNFIIEYSVGETVIVTNASTNNAITQGLLQPLLKIVPPPCELVNDTIQYFPNPVNSILSVVTRQNWISGYMIFASDGKLIRNAPFISNQIDLGNLPAGVYFIKIMPGCNNKFRILKVIKQ